MAEIGLPSVDLKEKDPSAQLRGAALWIFGAFVAIGAAQIIAVSLDGVDKLATNPSAMVLALIGFGVMFLGLGIGVMAAGGLLVPVNYTDKMWREDQSNFKGDYSFIIGPLKNPAGFQTGYTRWLEDYYSKATPPDVRFELSKEYSKFKQYSENWVEFRKTEILRENYEKAKMNILVGVIAAFVGIGLFHSASALIPNDALRTQISKINELEEALNSEQTALNNDKAELALKKKEVEQLESQWKQAMAGQDAAALLENRAKVLLIAA